MGAALRIRKTPTWLTLPELVGLPSFLTDERGHDLFQGPLAGFSEPEPPQPWPVSTP